MTPKTFEELALRLGAVEAHPILDTIAFKVVGRTFATLGWPGPGWAVARLSIAGQKRAIALSRAFQPEPSPRGERGVTLIRVGGAEPDALAEVLADAWREAFRSSAEAKPKRAVHPSAAEHAG